MALTWCTKLRDIQDKQRTRRREQICRYNKRLGRCLWHISAWPRAQHGERLQGPIKRGETKSTISISNPLELKLFDTRILTVGYAIHLAARSLKYKQDGWLDLRDMTNSSSKHKNGDNAVILHLSENAIAANGIIPDFPAAVVILLPRDPRHNVRVTGFIEIWIGFTLNPKRWWKSSQRETILCCWTGGRPRGSQLRQI